jgi:hypothetical protein
VGWSRGAALGWMVGPAAASVLSPLPGPQKSERRKMAKRLTQMVACAG